MTHYAWTPDEGYQFCATEAEARAIVAGWRERYAPDEPHESGTRGPEWGVLMPCQRWLMPDGAGGWVRS